MIDLGSLGGTFGTAQCANNRGQVIGQSNLPGDEKQHAFIWEDGTMKDLGTLGGSFSVVFWLNNAGEAVGGADTTDDESFHATLWKNGVITDLGTLDGDCASRALANNSKSQIIGQSFNCETETVRAVLWENGSIIDLNASVPPNSSLLLVEPFNINDRGEIVGRGLPAGCDSGEACGHIFLLTPCDHAGTEGCENNAHVATQARPASVPTATITARNSQRSKELVAQWRARLIKQYKPKMAPPGITSH
jgi:probable HAF family extracellular repeat protein